MKTNSLKVILGLLFLIAFNAFFFLWGGFDRTALEWICYGFIHVAYICLLITPVFHKERCKGDTVLLASLYLRALLYFMMELSLGVGFIMSNTQSFVLPTITQSVLLLAFFALQIAGVLLNDDTKHAIEKQRNERVHIRSLAMNLKDAALQVDDADVRKKILQCSELLNNCSLESFPEAMQAELELDNAINTLCMVISQGNKNNIEQQIKNIQIAIQNRNQAIRLARLS